MLRLGSNLSTLLIIFSLFGLATTHMQVMNPPPRQSKYSQYYLNSGLVDYNLASPLNPDGSNFPCQAKPQGPVQATLTGKNIVINQVFYFY